MSATVSNDNGKGDFLGANSSVTVTVCPSPYVSIRAPKEKASRHVEDHVCKDGSLKRMDASRELCMIVLNIALRKK